MRSPPPPFCGQQFAAPAYSSSEFTPSQMMKKQQQNRQHQKQFPPLPDGIVAHLKAAFKQLDRKGTGLVPFEYIHRLWPTNFSSLSSPLPPNFLATLRRISPPDRLITFQLFLHAAQLAMLERFAMSNGNVLKRTYSEGKLMRDGKIPRENNKNEENLNLIGVEERERSKTMGLAGRKLDNRENARLLKMKKASRSQPQLNELFGQQNGQRQKGLRRTEQFIDDEDVIFNMKFAEENDRILAGPNGNNERQRKPKSTKAPAPPIPSTFIESPVILPNNCDANNNNGLGNGQLAANYAALKRGGAVKAAGGNQNNNFSNGNGGARQTNYPPPQRQRPVSVAGLAPIATVHRADSSIGNSSIPMPMISPTICHQSQSQQSHEGHFHHQQPANNYADELQPQVAKHERLLEEEFQIVHSGHSMAHRLVEWYNGRVESLEKRRRMLQKGMVALDSAVHEQKLNFHRAQIAEMNRRIKAFLGASEGGGFPGHGNNSANLAHSQQPIRNQVLPPPFLPNAQPPPHSLPHSNLPPSISLPPASFNSTNSCSSSNASSSTNSSSASCSIPLDGAFSSASEAEFLRAQNQKLMRDIRTLSHQMEKLQSHQNVNGNGFARSQQNNNGWTKDHNLVWRGLSNANGNGCGRNFAQPAKDTLL